MTPSATFSIISIKISDLIKGNELQGEKNRQYIFKL